MAAFTSIAALGMSAAGSAFSFIQAGKQSKIEQQAQRDAANALAEAKKKLEVNMLSGLSIAKEPYELEREALLQQGAAALQAGVEGDQRGASATAGRVLQAQQQAQAEVRSDMAQEMADLDLLEAQEDVNLQGQRVGLDLGEVAGQQQIAADARAARAASMQAGVQGLVDVGLGAMEAGDAFSGTDDRRKANKVKRQKRRAVRRAKRG
jgi:hypothetical protein